MVKRIFLVCFLSLIGYTQAQNSVKPNKLETTIHTPKKTIKIKEGHYLVDFGKAFFGTVLIEPTKSQNDTIIFHIGEKLLGINRVDQKPGGTIRYQKVKLNDLSANRLETLPFISDKKNTSNTAILLPKEFGVVMPFRYVEIKNLKIPIGDIQIRQKALHYTFNDKASYFLSSNAVMDSIWNLCKHTIKATSFTGFYVDGDRERIPYEADAYINQLSHYSVDSEYSLGRRTNNYFVNNPTWPTEWLLHTVLMFHADYMYTGDIKPLKEHYENLKLKTLLDLERADGLISSKSPKLDKELILKLGFKKTDTKIKDIIDWPPAQKDTGWKLATAEGERDGYEIVDVNTVVNAFYYYNLKLMGEIATYLGKNEDAVFFQKKADITKETINTKLFDNSKGVYIDGEGSSHASLHGNMFPLAFDLVPKKHVKSVTEFIKSRGMACSVYGSQYLLEGLYKYNESDYASELITDTISDRSWWNMIKVGATMTMEAWDMKYKPNSDWNHAWGTAPLNVVTRYMWGVKPKTPGFKIAEIKPQLGNLTFSKIKVPTIQGAIYAEYTVDKNQQKRYEVKVPEQMDAIFVLSNTNKGEVWYNGIKVKKGKRSLKLKNGPHVIEIKPKE